MQINLEELIAFRQELHKHPELSGKEEKTANKLYDFLQQQHPASIVKNIGGHGIIATWQGKAVGKQIMLRADFDALPIQETNDLPYRSVTDQVSHKCGHDGHTTILCGVATFLKEKVLESGSVSLLFQPAEETGQGAKAMLEDENFPDTKFHHVYALHNLPGFPLAQVVVKENNFTPSVNSMIISLKGKTAHAAEPEHGVNPCMAIASILQQSMLLQYNFPDQEEMTVIAPIHIEAGEKAYGITAGEGSIHLTIRCWSQHRLEDVQQKIETLSRGIAGRYKLEIDISYTDSFVANYNDPRAVEVVRTAASHKKIAVQEISNGLKWGEDFGMFSRKYTGCMFGLGSGENCPALHNPDYDFPDEILETGIRIFTGIIEESTKLK